MGGCPSKIEVRGESSEIRFTSSQHESDRYVREKEKQDIAALHEDDPVEMHEVHLVLRQIEQRAVESINQVASKEENSEPQQQKEITQHETANQNFRQRVE